MKKLVIILLAALVVGVALTICWSIYRTPTYRAIAIVMIDRPVTEDAGPTRSDTFQERLNNEVTSLRKIGASMIGPNEQFLVKPIPKTHLVEVSVTGSDPVAAADRCNRIVDAYLEVVEGYVKTGDIRVDVRVVSKADVPKSRYR